MKIRNIAIWSTCLCLLGSTASCSSGKSVGSVSASPDGGGESAGETVIHLAVNGADSPLTKAVDSFNEMGTGWRVEIVDYYSPESAEDGSPQTDIDVRDFELVQDIINTKDIDIVTSASFHNRTTYINLMNKEAFADLNGFLENDSEINRTTLNSHVLDLNERNGKLMSIPTQYGVETMGGAAEYVGTKENWTLDEMLARWEEMPDNATIFGGRTKENAFYVTIAGSIENYIDWTSGTVSFDSDDFRKALEFCNMFEYGDQQKTDYDLSAPSFCYQCIIDAYMPTAQFELGSSQPKTTLVGYPSSDGKGASLSAYGYSFSILASSDENKQEGAWQFIRSFFTEEAQEENAVCCDEQGSGYFTQHGFCMNLKANESIKQRVAAKESAPSSFESKGETYETKFPTLADCDALDDYISRVDRWNAGIDESLYMIVREEAFAYFADEITLDECIDRIQNRTSIWVSEKI
ncbi:MAG: hypothetical protein Q4A05_11360 [Ruminococcus sp.]|nr:hypothetical protein [Ruminococcus sp.]